MTTETWAEYTGHMTGRENAVALNAQLARQVQQRVQEHDRYQVEFKLDYELIAGKMTRYQVQTYIFIPQSLGIRQETYPLTQFYKDIQNYWRLKTPTFTMDDIGHKNSSPLVRIEAIVQELEGEITPAQARQLIIHCKFLRAILKSASRGYFRALGFDIAQRPRAVTDEITRRVQGTVEQLLRNMQNILRRYRQACDQLQRVEGLPDEIMTAHQLTDESLSLLAEERLITALRVVELYMAEGRDTEELKQQLRATIHAEVSYRRCHFGRGSVLQPEDDNEEFLYRTSILKKFTSSVLYLSTSVAREGTALEQMLYAGAAGISMIFATVVAFYFQRIYGMFTLPLFAALVVGYMFKDRIKEMGRGLSVRYLQNKLNDRRIVIKSQDGKYELGYLREKVRFVAERDIPAEVMKVRNRPMLTALENDGQGETVICYTKKVVLYKDIFKRIYPDSPEITGINDILRYDVRPFLRKMADPLQRVLYLDRDCLRSAKCHKVYHINFVTAYEVLNPVQERTLTKTRLILNRKGIKRLEPLP